MKTRLLKKVRKRYSITRIDELASNDYELLEKAEKFELPFYYILDEDRGFEFEGKKYNQYYMYSKTKKEAITLLQKLIFNDYKEKFKHKDRVETKVWYVD